jgi:sec-independent protein translocase protein TatB
MFDIGWSELVVIAVVALIAIGPKELPNVLRMVGNYMGKIRRMASEFQGQFQEAMREAEMADLKKQVDEMTDTAKHFTDFDPIGDVRKQVDSFTGDPLGTTEPANAPSVASASPEAAAPGTPAPVSPDAVIPPPAADTTFAPEAPQPQPADEAKPETAKESAGTESVRSGSGG